MIADWHRVTFWCEENILKLIVVMAVQPCEHTKNHFKMGNFMYSLFYLNFLKRVQGSRSAGVATLCKIRKPTR